MGKKKSKRDASADAAMPHKKNKNLKKEEVSPHQLVGNTTNHSDKGNEGQLYSKTGKKKNKRDAPADAAMSQEKNKKLKKEEDSPQLVENATNHSDKRTGEQQNVDNHSNENGSEVRIAKTKFLGVNPSKGCGNKGEQYVEDVPTVNEKANGGGAEYEGLEIRVYNVPPKVKRKNIVKAFKDCGTIARVILPIDGASRTNSGFAFVKFEVLGADVSTWVFLYLSFIWVYYSKRPAVSSCSKLRKSATCPKNVANWLSSWECPQKAGCTLCNSCTMMGRKCLAQMSPRGLSSTFHLSGCITEKDQLSQAVQN